MKPPTNQRKPSPSRGEIGPGTVIVDSRHTDAVGESNVRHRHDTAGDRARVHVHRDRAVLLLGPRLTIIIGRPLADALARGLRP